MPSPSPSPSPKLVCRNVWKLFGLGAREFLMRERHDPSPARLSEHGLVAAVRDVDLEVRPGEIFVIMGLSGSGKSTLVRCLSRLVEPTDGEILFNGENLLAASVARMIEIRRHQMGMVFQNFALLPHLTVMANVAFPLEVQGAERGQREARAKKMIDLVGLSGKRELLPARFIRRPAAAHGSEIRVNGVTAGGFVRGIGCFWRRVFGAARIFSMRVTRCGSSTGNIRA